MERTWISTTFYSLAEAEAFAEEKKGRFCEVKIVSKPGYYTQDEGDIINTLVSEMTPEMVILTKYWSDPVHKARKLITWAEELKYDGKIWAFSDAQKIAIIQQVICIVESVPERRTPDEYWIEGYEDIKRSSKPDEHLKYGEGDSPLPMSGKYGAWE